MDSKQKMNRTARPNFQVFAANSFSIGRGGATLFGSRDCDYFFPTNTNTHSSQIQTYSPHKYKHTFLTNTNILFSQIQTHIPHKYKHTFLTNTNTHASQIQTYSPHKYTIVSYWPWELNNMYFLLCALSGEVSQNKYSCVEFEKIVRFCEPAQKSPG